MGLTYTRLQRQSPELGHRGRDQLSVQISDAVAATAHGRPHADDVGVGTPELA